jgi:hypothetical protein
MLGKNNMHHFNLTQGSNSHGRVDNSTLKSRQFDESGLSSSSDYYIKASTGGGGGYSRSHAVIDEVEEGESDVEDTLSHVSQRSLSSLNQKFNFLVNTKPLQGKILGDQGATPDDIRSILNSEGSIPTLREKVVKFDLKP